MKVKCIGKVKDRTMRKVKDYDLYSVTIEEEGPYPSVFQFSSKNASLFGQKDGPCGIGKAVVAEGFANGSAHDAQRKDGTHFTAYSVYLTLTKLEPLSSGAAVVVDPSASASDDLEDIPF